MATNLFTEENIKLIPFSFVRFVYFVGETLV